MPLAEESQFLFTFEDPMQPAAQLTWTVLPQGFRDSPHLFGQGLSWGLQNFNSSERSNLVSGPGLNSSPPEAKNPSVFS